MNVSIVLLIALLTSAADPALVLTKNGRAECTIVIPDDATETVRHAAEELAGYLKRISGSAIPILPESRAAQDRRIDVGPTRKTLSQLPKGFATDEERLFIRSASRSIVICGGGDRGTLFGVYRFLETLGCRWLTPEPEDEFVPRRPTLTVAPLNLDTRPAFEWRLFKGDGDPALGRWGLKMGLNGLYTDKAAKRNGECLYWPKGARGVHTYYQIMPNDRYFASHPEWYPLLDGQRVPTDVHGKQLCVTASGLADEFAANVNRILDAAPGCRVMSISPNDGRGWCECPACTALDRRLCGGRTTKQGLSGSRPFRGDRVFWFANEVAKRTAKKRPDAKLLILAYINYAEPPDTVRPLESVVPFLCHYAPADYSRPINDPDSQPNRQFNALLKRWIGIAPQLMIYSYVSKSMWWRLPRPVLRPFAADVRYLHRLGVRRYYSQSRLNDWPLDGPLYYVLAKLQWDPAADASAIAQDWIRHMFGPASAHMASFYDAVDDAVRKTGKPFTCNPPRDVPGLYDRASLDRALAAIERAEKTPADEHVARRVAKVAQTFRYGYWMIQCLEQQHRFRQTFDVAVLECAEAAGRKALAYYKHRRSAKLVASLRRVTQLGVAATGMGSREVKGKRRCWNTDETGLGDGRSGWAELHIPTPAASADLAIEIDVWGTSDLRRIVVNTSGDGRGSAEGGVWTRIQPEKGLSGKERWEKSVFRVPAAALARDRPYQRVGLGGADSQIWLAKVRVRTVDTRPAEAPSSRRSR